ncbi:MAG TPA: Ig-like domain-containing protein [Candidatus Limnocylindria bacterium]|nr:Ig-like domain-containing protein [Candidatus Limnocylindria bacterium]
MSDAFRSTRKSARSDFNSYALLLFGIISLGLAGCSGLVNTNGGNSGGPPTALTISSVQAATSTTSGFQVSWTTNVAANSAVDYGTSASYGSSTPVNSTLVTSHQMALTNLTTGTLYHFRVRSTDAKSNNAASNDMTFATAGDTTPPTVSITSPAANATLAGFVTMTASAADNVAVASVQFKVDNANTGTAITAAPYSYLLNTTTLANGNHIITAVAADSSGNAATSSGVAVKVNNTATTVPSIASLNPTSGPVGTSVTIAGTNFGATQGTSTVTFKGTAATATNWSAASITAAAPSGATTGNVVVTVGGVASNGVSFTVQADTTAPTVPTGLTATAISSSQINLSWTASTDNVGVTGYNVYRGGIKIGTAPDTSYQDSGLSASTSYTYSAAAFDVAGNTSAQSTGASATTQTASSGGGIPSALGWYQIPNTSIQNLCPSYSDIQGATGCKAVMSAWNGGLFDTKRNRLIIHGGGHTDYYGNEIYAIDLNANPIAPVLVKDASHGSAISNLGSCPEAFTDGTPNSRHIYNGELYLPVQDTYFLYGAFKSTCGNDTDGQWQYSPASGSWAQQSPSTHPNHAFNGSVPQFAYDSTTQDLYEVEDNTGIFWQYNIAANTWTNLKSVSACTGVLNMTTAIDEGRRLYFCVGNGGFGKVSLTAPYSATKLTGSGCSAIIGKSGPGFVYDPVQKLMVGWAGGDTAYIYNPDTDSCSSVTYSGGPTVIQGNGTFGRFNYSPALGVFVVANSIDTNAHSLRLTQSSGTGGGGPVISGVSVGTITTSGATVTWTTDVAATSQVEYGTTTAYGNLTTLNSTLVTSHAISLVSLATNTLFHYRVRSKNSSGVESISGDFAFQTSSVTDTTPPTISITAPANGATVSGTVTVSANASDNVAVTGVQFFLDGASLGLQLVTGPYSVSWSSTSTTNGAHTLTAQARDAAGNVGNAVAVSVTVSNATSTALQDFQTRCAQTGVIVCQGFDDPAVFTSAKWPASGLYPDANGTIQGTMDTTIAASGAGSLKFTVPSLASANSSGYWRQLFTQNLSDGPTSAKVYGANSTFYLQFRQRFSIEYLTNKWVTGSGSMTFWKQDILSNDNSTCGNVELTTVNWNQRRYPTMYSQCGADGFVVDLHNGDYLEEQGDTSATGYNCHYQTANNSATSCFTYPADIWVTFYYKVSIGTWGQPNSTIQAWVSVGAGPYTEFVNMPNHTLYEDTLAGADYDMVTLLTYMTGRSSTVSAGPTAYTWYDELIVSGQPIAPPNN